MNSVQRARKVLREEFPAAFKRCSTQATVYAKCVTSRDFGLLKKDDCVNEFNQFKECFKNCIKK